MNWPVPRKVWLVEVAMVCMVTVVVFRCGGVFVLLTPNVPVNLLTCLVLGRSNVHGGASRGMKKPPDQGTRGFDAGVCRSIWLLNLVVDSGEALVDVVLLEFVHHFVNLLALQRVRCFELGVAHGGGVERESLVEGAGGLDGGVLGGGGRFDVAGACAAVGHWVGGHDGGFPFLWLVGGFG